MEINPGTVVPVSALLFVTLVNCFCTLSLVALLRSQLAVLGRPELESRLGNKCARIIVQNPKAAILLLQMGISASLFGFLYVLLEYNIPSRLLLLIEVQSPLSLQLLAVSTGLFLIYFFFAWIVPSAVALRDPENVLMRIAPTLYFSTFLFRPLLLPFAALAQFCLKPFRLAFPDNLEFNHSAEDISRLFDGNGNGVDIDEDEKEMLQGVFEFSETVAREVMTPRTDIITLSIGATLSETVDLANESGRSRFPVRGDSIDDIRGVLLVRDLLPILGQAEKEATFSVTSIMRKAYFVSDTKPIDDLLNEFKRRTLHMAIVLDEHGGVDGLVTLEDLLEEIVGEIFDESDTPEEGYAIEASGDVLVDGGMTVFELNEQFSLQIPEGDYDTIAGFIFTSLGRMPLIGDIIDIEENGVVVVTPGQIGAPLPSDTATERVSVIVESIENNRISLVRIKPQNNTDKSETLRSQAAS